MAKKIFLEINCKEQIKKLIKNPNWGMAIFRRNLTPQTLVLKQCYFLDMSVCVRPFEIQFQRHRTSYKYSDDVTTV